MRVFLWICLSAWLCMAENSTMVVWKIDITKEASKNKYPFSEISEYLYDCIQSKKIPLYTDSTCKNKLNKENFTQYLYQKNQSVAGYTILKIGEKWRFSTKGGILSKVIFLSYENPSLPEKDTHRNLYVSPKYISSMLNEIKLSGYYQGRANIPLSEWIKKHDFEYTMLYTSAPLPKPPYLFEYNKEIDDTTYKKIQLLFDFFPEKNEVYGRTYTRNKDVFENFVYVQSYTNEYQNGVFRSTLLDFLKKNKLLKKENADIEEILGNSLANYVFYFEGIRTKLGIEWTNIRVYLSSGKSATTPQILCGVVPKNKIKSIERYFKEKVRYSFTEYFTSVKIDFLVSYINNSYAKDVEEGLFLRRYLFDF